MDLAVIALTFGAIFVVELPDKTFLATLVLGDEVPPDPRLDRRRPGLHRADRRSRCARHAASFLPEELVQRRRRG